MFVPRVALATGGKPLPPAPPSSVTVSPLAQGAPSTSGAPIVDAVAIKVGGPAAGPATFGAPLGPSTFKPLGAKARRRARLNLVAAFALGASLAAIFVGLAVYFATTAKNTAANSLAATPTPVALWPTTGAFFGYVPGAADGPSGWGSIKDPATGLPRYPDCALTNKYQSPINLPTTSGTHSVVSVRTAYPGNYFDLVIRPRGNPGYQVTTQPACPAPANASTCGPGGIFGDIPGELVADFDEFHLHGPSEHTVNGVSYPLELHMVHVTAGVPAGAPILRQVIGILFPYSADGSHNRLLDSFITDASGAQYAPLRLGGKVPLDQLMADTEPAYWRYDGGLTSPPCSAGVTWRVFTAKTGVSLLQAKAFAEAVGTFGNTRPVQPLAGRTVDVLVQR